MRNTEKNIIMKWRIKMKKKIIKIIVGILLVISLMFAEFFVIINNIEPYRRDGGELFIEIFGQTYTYYADNIIG